MSSREQPARDVGSAGIETVFAVTGLLLVLFFVVGGMRVVNSNGDVSAAARAGARAAATARTSGQANSDAVAVVTNMLAGRGVACAGGPGVSVSGAGVPGNAVTVTVMCTVSLSDVVIVGFPGSRNVTVSAVEYVDGDEGCGMSDADDDAGAVTESHDRGDTMLMTIVLITFLLLGSWALISASQQWGARRDVQAVSSAAARAGAQVSEVEVRGGSVAIDPSRAASRAGAVLAASGYAGAVSVNGLTVTVTATGSVDYAFPAPGFPGQLSATSTAVAVRGVEGTEGG